MAARHQMSCLCSSIVHGANVQDRAWVMGGRVHLSIKLRAHSSLPCAVYARDSEKSTLISKRAFVLWWANSPGLHSEARARQSPSPLT
jgi:hypothetical protein